MRIHSDRRFRFAEPRDEVWAALVDVDHYRDWWPWLREFDAQAVRAGETWTCAVRPPVPYVVRFACRLDAVDGHRSVDATITGDIVGTARIELTDVGPTTTEVRLLADLAPAALLLRTLHSVARPITRRSHDWIIDTGARQFEEHALAS